MTLSVTQDIGCLLHCRWGNCVVCVFRIFLMSMCRQCNNIPVWMHAVLAINHLIINCSHIFNHLPIKPSVAVYLNRKLRCSGSCGNGETTHGEESSVLSLHCLARFVEAGSMKAWLEFDVLLAQKDCTTYRFRNSSPLCACLHQIPLQGIGPELALTAALCNCLFVDMQKKKIVTILQKKTCERKHILYWKTQLQCDRLFVH